MFRPTHSLVLIAVLIAGCTSQPKEDPRVAELQKELETAKQELAAKGEAAPAATAPAETRAAAPQAAPAPPPAPAAPAAPAPAMQTAEQASKDRRATEQALAEQRSATERQADENAKLRRELDAMKPREFTLPAGTPIGVRTTAELSTKSVKNGSVFDALLERDLVMDGTILAKAGSRVSCIVVSSDPGGRVKGVASMSVAARSIAGVDANTLTVKTDSYSVDADTTKGKDAAKTGIAAGAGAVIGAIAGGGKGAAIGAGAGAAAGAGANLLTRGEAAVIPTETLIEFKLAAPATVVLRK